MSTTLRRYSLYQLVALCVLALSVMILGFFAIQSQSSLCAFKRDLDQRIKQGQALLAEDPNDPVIHAYGLEIPRPVLKNTINGQLATQRSFGGLFCGKG